MRKFTISIFVAIAIASQCQAVTNLTADSLGLTSGNYGTSLTINDFLIITAITHIGQADMGSGTVYVTNTKGVGVQTADRRGTKSISGSGSNQDEALVLTFAQNVPASSIVVGLQNYNSTANPIIKLTFADNSEISFSESHPVWTSAIMHIGSGNVTVNLGMLLGSGFGESASRLSVTETTGQIYVNSIGYSVSSVPEPTTIALLGFGCLAALPVRKQK